MIDTKLTNQRIQIAEILAMANPPQHGAQIVFSGIVRNHNQGQTVLGVSYDAHQVLAERVFRQIAEEAMAKWGPDLLIRVVHRFGRLDAGEISLLVLTSSRHRDEAYLASRFVLEQIKHRAPIWKKEHYVTGDSEWLEGHALCGHHDRVKEAQA